MILGVPAIRETPAQAEFVKALPPAADAQRRKRDASQADPAARPVWYAQGIGKRRASYNAVFALWARMPEYSARIVATRPQLAGLCVGSAAFVCAFFLWPFLTAHILVAGMSAGFIASIAFRTVLARIGRRREQPVPAVTDGEVPLPVYTVLVPLYREAQMLPQLVRALSAFDYPQNRLDIKFVVEADDAETIAAAQSCIGTLSAEVVVVPYSRPRTKPKACNYALHFARGDYVVVYDAEDRPEPDQLRKAVETFRAAEGVGCLQARLTIDNERSAWLARGIMAQTPLA